MKRAIGLLSESDLQITKIMENWFILKFQSKTDMIHTMYKQPILIYDSLMLLKEQNGKDDPTDVHVDTVSCWV